MNNLHFRSMALFINLRNLLSPPKEILKEAGIKLGHTVVDYGCGPGGHSVAAAKLSGKSGKVYALDIHPLAIESVQKKALQKRLINIKTILSDCATGLADSGVDVVLLYDTFHELNDPDSVLTELARVLKSDGVLSFSDHHLEEGQIVSGVAGSGLFGLLKKDKKTYTFRKNN